MIDINGGSTNPVAARLSNFTLRTFDFDGIQCLSIEGVLQAFKFEDKKTQLHSCLISPKKAKNLGTKNPQWKINQKLFWWEYVYPRQSFVYESLVARLYDTAYNQDPTFKDDLLALGDEEICHSIGKTDPRDTVLTEAEFLFQLNRLRKRANHKVIGRSGARMHY
jgi:predicted NAD-dependent protein-ADP-ribosyltransferase YbiA (DUF1768 family)